MMRSLTLALAILGAGCGLLGDDSPQLRRVRNGGTGPFRALTADDTGLSGTPEGRIANDIGLGTPLFGKSTVGRVAWNDSGCYASFAPLLSPTPPRDPLSDPNEPDPSQFEPMRIVRCDADDGAVTTTLVNETVLTASEPWEGTSLGDPWPLRLPDGTIRLYYVAAGSIGVAQADDPAGPFTRLTAAPIMTPLDVARPLRSPSVIIAPDGYFLMYFDDGARVFVAESEDGITFQRLDTDDATPETDPLVLEPALDEETVQTSPGVLVTRTGSGIPVVRMYFNVVSKGKTNVCMAGSFDGRAFERFAPSSYRATQIGAPVARVLPAGETVLSLTQIRVVSMVVVRNPVGAVAPIFAVLGTPAD